MWFDTVSLIIALVMFIRYFYGFTIQRHSPISNLTSGR
jgi:hypothetical protein